MPGLDPRDYANGDHDDTSSSAAQSTNVENIKLYMPSELNPSNHRKFCPNGLASIEDRIQFAEASDSLEDLRHHLRTCSFANKFKITNVTGQIKNTCAWEVQHHINDKVQASELWYQCAQEALRTLCGPGDWETKLKVLMKSDVRALNEQELNRDEQDEVYQMRQ
jgi:carboxypeptidase C (cathepsin A)